MNSYIHSKHFEEYLKNNKPTEELYEADYKEAYIDWLENKVTELNNVLIRHNMVVKTFLINDSLKSLFKAEIEEAEQAILKLN